MQKHTQSEEKKSRRYVLLGAALLMATSAVGPGFLTQSATFTATYMGQLAIIMVLVILMDIITKLNVWSIIGVSGKRAPELANEVLPGLGQAVSLLVAFGGLVFNIGNVGGIALALNALFHIPEAAGCVLGGAFAIVLLASKNASGGIDLLAKCLGAVMVLIALVVAVSTRPPVDLLACGFFHLEEPVSLLIPMITILGGSCGGYISFSGVHRLLDAGIYGRDNLSDIRKSVLLGSGVTGVIRLLLFLAAYGVCMAGGNAVREAVMQSSNPAAEVFLQALGDLGFRLFAVILLCASLSTVTGAAYTSVSFLKTLHPVMKNHSRAVTILFILLSSGIMAVFGGAARLLVLAGAVNGLILPVSLSVILIAGRKKSIVGDYRHSFILTVLGLIIVLITLFFGLYSIAALF